MHRLSVTTDEANAYPQTAVAAPRDLQVRCSCGQQLEGGGPLAAFALMVQAWRELHERALHEVQVVDPRGLLCTEEARRPGPLTVEHYRVFLLHHARDPD